MVKEKHGSTYSPMRLRIWAEMKVGGLHTSLAEPPTTTMFHRAGGSGGKRRDAESPVIKAFTDAANPAKVIENRKKLYKQLSD